MADVMLLRMFRPWIHLDSLFRLSPLAREQAKYLAILHDMANSVIRTRKDEYLQKRPNSLTTEERNDIGKTPRR
jgi:hypothetical protein